MISDKASIEVMNDLLTSYGLMLHMNKEGRQALKEHGQDPEEVFMRMKISALHAGDMARPYVQKYAETAQEFKFALGCAMDILGSAQPNPHTAYEGIDKAWDVAGLALSDIMARPCTCDGDEEMSIEVYESIKTFILRLLTSSRALPLLESRLVKIDEVMYAQYNSLKIRLS